MKQKSRVIQGTKEAKWNHKYMKVIEKPVIQVEQATNLKDVQLVIVSLLKSLKNIYENSNFYKEARIVSFIDRLLACIISKLKAKFTINLSVIKGKQDYTGYEQELQHATSVISKFQENFWVAELMQPSKQGFSDQPMDQSFYSKQGLDFLYFARPGTAYGPGQSFGKTTAQGFFQADKKTVKPVEMIRSKNQSSLLQQLWFERAQKVLSCLDHMRRLVEFFSYIALVSHRFHHEIETDEV